MLLLVTIAHGQIEEYRHMGGLGRMVQPRHYPKVRVTARAGIPWAADNDCFQGLDGPAYLKMLGAISNLPGCLFVTVPDVVADHEATRALWDDWKAAVKVTGLPRAFVLQNGATSEGVPWDEADAVFVGGDTDWKLGAEASALTFEAHERGKWVHMGRVNSRKRFRRAAEMYCDSVDGTSYARFRDTNLPTALGFHREPLPLALPGA